MLQKKYFACNLNNGTNVSASEKWVLARWAGDDLELFNIIFYLEIHEEDTKNTEEFL